MTGYCVTVIVTMVEMGQRLVTRDQRSGVTGYGVTRDPFPPDPSPSFPHPERLKEEARVCEMAELDTPLENQESMF